jgi:uncharacterized repeat protein (TIGR01451 family)
VSLTDLLPAGLTATAANGAVTQGSYDAATGLFDIGTLNIGETAVLTLEGTVDVGQGGNTITNITTAATGDQPDPSSAGDDLDESVVVDANADLVTQKTLLSGDATPEEGDAVTFQITVTNNGTAQASGVSLTDQLPTGITFTGSAVSQGSYNSATGLWTIGTLNETAVATIELTGTVDVGQGGNTITNVTTAATGDQPDPSTAGDDLDEAVVVENLADLVTEKTLISGNPVPEEGDSVTFQIAVTNNGAAQATGVSLVDQLPAGITFTGSSATQGTYNAATGLWTVGTIDEGAVAVITLTGTVDVGQAGNTITNITTAATGDQIDPSTVGDDLEESVSPLVVADLGIAKSTVGEPILTDTGNYVVTYQLVIENTGNVDLADLSLLEDLEAQFGAPFVDAGNLTITVAPTDADSSVSVDSANWNGSTAIELIDTASSSLLAVGDSFTIQFDVEIDPTQVVAPLENQVEGSGDAVSSDGTPLTDSSGTPIVATDDSDSGTDPNSTNSDDPSDQGTPDDPTLFDPPAIPTSQITGSVFFDENQDGSQGTDEIGIEGVEVTLTGTDVYGNPVEVTVLTDSQGNYSFDGLNAGTYSITQTQPQEYDDGTISGPTSDIQIGFGEEIEAAVFAEILPAQESIDEDPPGATGNPPRLPGFLPPNFTQIGGLISGFLGSPGPIYSGVPINANADPLSLDSGRAVTGGYAPDAYDTGDCACECECDCSPEPVDPCSEVVECDPCGESIITQPAEPIIDDACGCEVIVSPDQCSVEEAVIEAPTEPQCDPCQETIGIPAGLGKPSFLKRFTNWIQR